MRLDPTMSALGFAPHSGWAAVVGIESAGVRPHVIVRERIPMADPADAGSRQPYHSVRGLPIERAAERLAAYVATAESMALLAVERIVDRLAREGHRVIGLGISESAGRKGSSLAETLASHALIHAADGDHFRDAVAGAAARCRLTASRVRARDLTGVASAAVGLPIEELNRALAEAGREAGPPWGSDQKAAALLAWLVLAEASGRGAGWPTEPGNPRSRTKES